MKAAPWEEEFDAHFPRLYRSIEYYEYEECTGDVKEFIEALLAKQSQPPQGHPLTLMGRDSGPEAVYTPQGSSVFPRALVTGDITIDGKARKVALVFTEEQSIMTKQHETPMTVVNGRPMKVQLALTSIVDTYVSIRNKDGEDVYVPLSEIIEAFKRSLVNEIRHGRNDE